MAKKPLKTTTPAKDRKIPPVVIQPPKTRVPVAPPGQEHRDRRLEEKLRPAGRKAKHKT